MSHSAQYSALEWARLEPASGEQYCPSNQAADPLSRRYLPGHRVPRTGACFHFAQIRRQATSDARLRCAR